MNKVNECITYIANGLKDFITGREKGSEILKENGNLTDAEMVEVEVEHYKTLLKEMSSLYEVWRKEND